MLRWSISAASRSQIRDGNAPLVVASLRYLAITILSLIGATSIAAALELGDAYAPETGIGVVPTSA